MGRRIALGYSREPPVATFFGRMERAYEYRGLAYYMPKRLPSSPWDAAHPLLFFELFAPIRGYSFFLGTPAANGNSAFNHLAKLSFTDSGAISAIRLV